MNKLLDIGWGRLRLAFDLYNALNSNSVQNVTTPTRTLVAAIDPHREPLAASDDVPGSAAGARDGGPAILKRPQPGNSWEEWA